MQLKILLLSSKELQCLIEDSIFHYYQILFKYPDCVVERRYALRKMLLNQICQNIIIEHLNIFRYGFRLAINTLHCTKIYLLYKYTKHVFDKQFEVPNILYGSNVSSLNKVSISQRLEKFHSIAKLLHSVVRKQCVIFRNAMKRKEGQL